jgi:hypothetical protein
VTGAERIFKFVAKPLVANELKQLIKEAAVSCQKTLRLPYT